MRAEELGAVVATDLAAIAADRTIDGFVVCSETDLHEGIVAAIAPAGKPVFIEKPLGITARDSSAMAAALDSHRCTFQTGYFQRGDPKHLFIRQQLKAGAFGKVTRIRGCNCHSGSLGGWFDTDWRWMADPARAGCGAYGDLGTHSLDIMLWLMGEVETATALTGTGTERYKNAGGVACDETGEGLMKFKNGAIGTLAAAWTDLANPVSLQVSGTEGHAAVINGQLHFVSKKLPQFDGTSPVRTSELPPAEPAGFDAFLDTIEGKPTGTLVTAKEAAYRVAVMEAMYAGARTGTWVAPG
jgi:predicted dehydrogenase